MSLSISHQRFPIAYLLHEQIAYVTDNDRDAEALSCETEYPVVIKRPKETSVEPFTERPNVPTLQTSEISERSNVQDASDAPDILNVSDVSSDANVSDVPGVENHPDALDVYNVPDVQASDL